MQIRDQFILYLKTEKRLSEATIISYRTDLVQFEQFLQLDGRSADLEVVKAADVRAWMLYLMDSGLTARSVHRKISGLRHFYRYLQRLGLAERNPAQGLVLPRVSKRLPDYVEEVALQSLFDEFPFPEDFQGLQNRLILELLYGAGLRLSELVELQEASFDFDRHTVRVRGKGSKDRLVPYPGSLAALLRRHLDLKLELFGPAGGPSFFLTSKGKKIYPKFVYRLVKKYLSYVTTIKKRSPHILRHSYATHLLNHGADINAIKELLGHSSLAATQVYTHTDLSKLKTIHKRAHPRAGD